MMKLTLTQRLSLVFSVLLLACSGASAWLQIRANDMREQEVVQGLSRDLAANIVNSVTHNAPLMDANGLRPDAVRTLFGQLMGVNPSVEVYLLDNAGRIKGDDAPPGHVKRDRVDLAPVQRFIAGEPLPIHTSLVATSVTGSLAQTMRRACGRSRVSSKRRSTREPCRKIARCAA